jgi:hypothetical protein
VQVYKACEGTAPAIAVDRICVLTPFVSSLDHLPLCMKKMCQCNYVLYTDINSLGPRIMYCPQGQWGQCMVLRACWSLALTACPF